MTTTNQAPPAETGRRAGNVVRFPRRPSARGTGRDRTQVDPALRRIVHASLAEQGFDTRLDWLTHGGLRRKIAIEASAVVAGMRPDLHASELDALIALVTSDYDRLGCLEPLLDDPAVEAIHVDGPGRVLIESEGRILRAPVSFAGPEQLHNAAERLLAEAAGGDPHDSEEEMAHKGWVEGHLHGSGVVFAVRTGERRLRTPQMSLRKSLAARFGMADMVDAGHLSAAQSRLIQGLVDARCSLLITGPKGSGHLSLLAAIDDLAAPFERVERRFRHPMTAAPVPTARPVALQSDVGPDRISIALDNGEDIARLARRIEAGQTGVVAALDADGAQAGIARVEAALSGGADAPPADLTARVASGFQFILEMRPEKDRRGVLRRIACIEGPDESGRLGLRALSDTPDERPRRHLRPVEQLIEQEVPS